MSSSPAPKVSGFDMPSNARQAYIDMIWDKHGDILTNLVRVPNHPVASPEETMALFEAVIGEGGEGVIVRKDLGSLPLRAPTTTTATPS